MSVEIVTNPVWGIFEPEHMDLSTVEKEMTEYREMNVSNISGLPKFEIETRDKDSFILPHEGQLEVRFQIKQADGTTNIPATDIIALQNNGLSLFKRIEYHIEDQLIEYTDEPGLGYTVKNLSEFSKQYGESIASNQHFYLDTLDIPVSQHNNVRFWNNANPADQVEVFFTVNNAGSAVPTVAGNAPNGAPIIATVNGFALVFKSGGGTIVRTLVMNAGLLALTDNAASVDNDPIIASVTLIDGGLSIPVTFYSDDVVVQPLQNGATGAIRPIDGFGADGNEITAFANMPNTTYYNTGFLKRAELAAGSTEVSLWIPLKNMFMFCRSYDKVSRGLRHKLVLNRQDDSQMLLRLGGADRTVVFTYISCWIPRLKPNLDTLKMLEGKLASNDLYTVNFTDLTVWRTGSPQPAAANNAALQLATTTKKPIRVWVVFQRTQRVDSTQVWNKRVFDHVNTTNIQCRLNGRQYPLYEYKIGPNFTSYNRLYHAFLSAGHKNADCLDGSLIDINTFKSLYPIFYFDLTAQEEDLWTAVKYAELEIRWSNQSTFQYYTWVIYESERVIKFKGVAGSLAIQL